MLIVNKESFNGWCCIAIDSDSKLMGLVSKNEEEITPCIFSKVATHLSEPVIGIRYKNALFQLVLLLNPEQQQYSFYYEPGLTFIFGGSGLFRIEPFRFIPEDFLSGLGFGTDDYEIGVSDINSIENDKGVIESLLSEIKKMLQVNICTEDEFERRKSIQLSQVM